MILQPCNVELTKIHYYDTRKWESHFQVASISREISQNDFNKNVIIKRNIFGHKWVLKINEDAESEKKKTSKLVVYILVFCSISVAVAFGVFFSVEKYFKETHSGTVVFNNTNNKHTPTEILVNSLNVSQTTHEKQITVLPDFDRYNSSLDNNLKTKNGSYDTEHPTNNIYCQECIQQTQVCIKLSETDIPTCVEKLDITDPTGCGGLCKINTEFCRLLDRKNAVFQCFPLKHFLKCPNDTFNCGNMCVPMEKRCDGVVNCLDKSDEIECDCNLKTHFQCGNYTSCLENSKKCNGIVDCWDKTDELNCGNVAACKEDSLPCLNGQCIEKNMFCNKNVDCEDRSDEPVWCQ